MTYDVVLVAIERKQQLTGWYRGKYREVCPHVAGDGKCGNKMFLGFQFGGTSNSVLPEGGEWRCFQVDEFIVERVREGSWHSGGSHLKPQTCVKKIDREVDDDE